MFLDNKKNSVKKSKSNNGPGNPNNNRYINPYDLSSVIQRFQADPRSFSHDEIIQLQMTYGNQAVCQLLKEAGIIGNSTKSIKNDRTFEEKTKANMEKASGIKLNDVNVHYNSSEPSKYNALAFTKGKEIHVARGQEQHLPHELWHAVQQKQGRVRPTMQMKGQNLNNDKGLEKEADVMGGRYAADKKEGQGKKQNDRSSGSGAISKSVGKNGVNNESDVIIVQQLLNKNIDLIVPLALLDVDGKVGEKTIFAIEEFQRRVVMMEKPDGLVSARGKTIRCLQEGRNPDSEKKDTIKKEPLKTTTAIAGKENKSTPNKTTPAKKTNGLINGSVGEKGKNDATDVLRIQKLINLYYYSLIAEKPLAEDGKCGTNTKTAIKNVQKEVMGIGNPNGKIEPEDEIITVLFKEITRNIFKKKEKKPGNTSVKKEAESGKEEKKSGYFSHPGASKVTLTYSPNAPALLPEAATVLKSILASCDIKSAYLSSTKRSYYHQARITVEQTYPKKGFSRVKDWYGQKVAEKCKEFYNDKSLSQENRRVKFGEWWQKYDKDRGGFSSRHLTNQAIDVNPGSNRDKFAKKIQELIKVSGSGVKSTIPKGTRGEDTDHVVFTFNVCP